MRTQREDGHLQARKQALTRHQICWCFDLPFPNLHNGEKCVCCLSHPIYGILKKTALTKTGHTANKWQFQNPNSDLPTPDHTGSSLDCSLSTVLPLTWDSGPQEDNLPLGHFVFSEPVATSGPHQGLRSKPLSIKTIPRGLAMGFLKYNYQVWTCR